MILVFEKMQSGTKWVGDEDSLSAACLWLQCLHPFGSHPQAGKFPSSDLPHSWVVWNNWWLQSNQMPAHQHLPLCSSGHSAIICGSSQHWITKLLRVTPQLTLTAANTRVTAQQLAFVALCSWPTTSLCHCGLSMKSTRQEVKQLILPSTRELWRQMRPSLLLSQGSG